MVKIINMRVSTDLKVIKVTDENGEEIITFKKSIALPTRSRYSIINANNENIGTIEKMRYNFGLVDLPQIDISVNNDEIRIKRDMKELKEFYEIMGSDFSIVGNLFGPHFNINKNEKVVASITIEKEEIGRSYLADIIDKSNEEQVVCILFALSWIM